MVAEYISSIKNKLHSVYKDKKNDALRASQEFAKYYPLQISRFTSINISLIKKKLNP